MEKITLLNFNEHRIISLINENVDLTFHADNFIMDVLKLGSKQNLFDEYMHKNKINPNNLNDFVSMVINRLKEKWT